MNRIAIIPARSGSKGLKDKNIIDLCGKPMIAYSIEAGLQSGLFQRVLVSTDSPLYGEIAERYGAQVLYRGRNLSDDNATTFMVVEDVLAKLSSPMDYFALLQPSSPLRTAQHLREAAALFESRIERFDFLVSLTEAPHSKILVNPLGEDGSLKYFDEDFSNYRRQKQRDFTPNGAIFMAKPEAYLRQKHFFGEKSVGYLMSREDSVDIDTPLDYDLAKLCMTRKSLGKEA